MEKLKIFYAWQSDTSTKLNRHLIHAAAEEAIKILNADIAIEDAPAFELDHDTKDVPGSPVVAEEICRKIDECSIFLADLSFVARYAKADGTTMKWTPNPNVLIEFGYARRSKGVHRLILVVNTGTLLAIGDPKGKATDLPFDLAHLRHPIRYNLTDSKDEENISETQADLAKDLAAAIKTALKTVIAQEQLEKETVRKGEVELSMQRVAKVRSELEKRVTERRFRDFATNGSQPALAFGLIPLVPLSPPLDVIGRLDTIRQRIKPIGSTGWEDQIAAGTVWFFSRTTTSTGSTIRDAVTEIVNDGSLFAATAIHIELPADARSRAIIDFLYVEREVFEAVESALRLFRSDLHIDRDVAFCLSLHGARNCILAPRNKYYRNRVRPISDNQIICPPVTIPAGIIPTGVAEVAVLIRDSFNYVWQECGLEYDPFIPQPPRTG